MLNKARRALHYTTTAFDEDIQDLIDAAYLDLLSGGVQQSKLDDDQNPLIIRAVLTYVKAYFGSNPDSDRMIRDYNTQKLLLSLDGDGGA
jgi:hypothetical protein